MLGRQLASAPGVPASNKGCGGLFWDAGRYGWEWEGSERLGLWGGLAVASMAGLYDPLCAGQSDIAKTLVACTDSSRPIMGSGALLTVRGQTSPSTEEILAAAMCP